MSDQCKNCTLRGEDIKETIKAFRQITLILQLIIILLVILLLTGCTHQRAVISTDSRKVLEVVRMADMPEKEAQRVWLESGVYRGLTDNEWIETMLMLEAMNEMKKGKQ